MARSKSRPTRQRPLVSTADIYQRRIPTRIDLPVRCVGFVPTLLEISPSLARWRLAADYRHHLPADLSDFPGLAEYSWVSDWLDWDYMAQFLQMDRDEMQSQRHPGKSKCPPYLYDDLRAVATVLKMPVRILENDLMMYARSQREAMSTSELMDRIHPHQHWTQLAKRILKDFDALPNLFADYPRDQELMKQAICDYRDKSFIEVRWAHYGDVLFTLNETAKDVTCIKVARLRNWHARYERRHDAESKARRKELKAEWEERQRRQLAEQEEGEEREKKRAAEQSR
ncbi:MAG: hypothetical protein M1817_006450 [Caeruleum heppii]|nr:MAG: hypothetical protein M1817_006450 [Caeruleum heppii]